MSTIEVTIAEIPWGRERYGGDARAINRHSTRSYVSDNGCEYTLDRTLDALPPYFTLWAHTTALYSFIPSLGEVVPVDGADHWGDGWGWPQAQQAALRAIAAVETAAV